MANGKVRGITIEFAADSSGLTKALKEADSAAKKSTNSLKQIDKALKLNPNNITLLKQKQVELQKSIESTKKVLDGFKQELAAMDASGVDKTDERYMALQRNILSAENELKRFNTELKQTNNAASSFGQLGSQMQAVGSKCTQLGQSMSQISAAAAGVVLAIGGVTVSTGVWADDLNTLSKITGIATDKLQVYAAAAELVDVDVSTIATSVARMKKNMLTASQGTGDAAKAFESLGISVVDASGNLRDQDAVFQELLQALGSMDNETERDALAMQIFGRSAASLNPLIEDMGQTYKDVADMMSENGIDPLDQAAIDKANDFNDSIDKMKLNLFQAKTILGSKLAEAFGDDMEKLSKTVGNVASKIANMNPTVLKIITIIAGVIAVVGPLLIIIGTLITSIGAIISALPVLGAGIAAVGGVISTILTALAANPIGAVIIAIMALILIFKQLYDNCEGFRKVVDKVIAKISELAGKFVDFAKNAVSKLRDGFKDVTNIGKNLVVGLWNGINNKFQWLVGKIKSFTNGVKNKLKAFFGIKSPSKWARDVIGTNIALGIGEGFAQSMSGVTDGMRSTISGSKSALTTQTDVVGQMSSAVSAGLAVANSGPSSQKLYLQVDLGGAKVAEQVYRLNKQGQFAMEG